MLIHGSIRIQLHTPGFGRFAVNHIDIGFAMRQQQMFSISLGGFAVLQGVVNTLLFQLIIDGPDALRAFRMPRANLVKYAILM